jgi:hypothetical protein
VIQWRKRRKQEEKEKEKEKKKEKEDEEEEEKVTVDDVDDGLCYIIRILFKIPPERSR